MTNTKTTLKDTIQNVNNALSAIDYHVLGTNVFELTERDIDEDINGHIVQIKPLTYLLCLCRTISESTVHSLRSAIVDRSGLNLNTVDTNLKQIQEFAELARLESEAHRIRIGKDFGTLIAFNAVGTSPGFSNGFSNIGHNNTVSGLPTNIPILNYLSRRIEYIVFSMISRKPASTTDELTAFIEVVGDLPFSNAVRAILSDFLSAVEIISAVIADINSLNMYVVHGSNTILVNRSAIQVNDDLAYHAKWGNPHNPRGQLITPNREPEVMLKHNSHGISGGI